MKIEIDIQRSEYRLTVTDEKGEASWSEVWDWFQQNVPAGHWDMMNVITGPNTVAAEFRVTADQYGERAFQAFGYK